jgi:hypothetical protein
VSLTAGQVAVDRVAEGIDQSVDLGAQSTARASDRLAGFFGSGAVLMGAHNGAVDHRVFVSASAARCWETRCQTAEWARRLKRRCTFFQSPKRSREIAPRNAGAITIQHSLDEQPVNPPRSRPRNPADRATGP